MDELKIIEAVNLIINSKSITAFTGAGISVESGIPTFRGKEGLWSKYDPNILDLNTYKNNPEKSWPIIKKLFFDYMGNAKPNTAHLSLYKLQELGFLKATITQNIDSLHQQAGNSNVFEFHGNARQLVCFNCDETELVSETTLTNNPPKCKNCDGLLKPDFVFFGEGISESVYVNSRKYSENCDIMLVIGTTGEIVPASSFPYLAKENGAKIIEINTEKSTYTDSITDVFLQGKATEVMSKLVETLEKFIK